MDIALHGEIAARIQANKNNNDSLRPGLVLKGRVIENKDGKVTVFAQGTRLELESSRNLEVNTDVVIKIKEGKSNNLLIEIMPEDSQVDITKDEMPFDYQQKQNNLKLNIEGSKEQFIAKVLVSKNLPPSEQNIKEITDFLVGVQLKEQNDLINIISDLKAKNIPVTSKTIEIFAQAQQGSKGYGNILEDLRNNLVTFKDAILSQKIGIEKAEAADKLIATIDNIIINLNTNDKNEIARQLNDFVAKVGFDYENELAKNLLFGKVNDSGKGISDLAKTLKGNILNFLDSIKYQAGNFPKDLLSQVSLESTKMESQPLKEFDMPQKIEEHSGFLHKEITSQTAQVLDKIKLLKPEQQAEIIAKEIDKVLKDNGINIEENELDLATLLDVETREQLSAAKSLIVEQSGNLIGRDIKKTLSSYGINITDQDIDKAIADISKVSLLNKNLTEEEQIDNMLNEINNILQENGIDPRDEKVQLRDLIENKIKDIFMKGNYLSIDQKASRLAKEVEKIIELTSKQVEKDASISITAKAIESSIDTEDRISSEKSKSLGKNGLLESELNVVQNEKPDGKTTLDNNFSDQKLKKIETHLESVLQKIETQQLHSNNQGNIQNPPYYLVYLPVKVGEQVFDGELKVFKDPQKKNRSIDPDNFRIAFFLNTANLGPLQIDLSVAKKRVNCIIGVEGEDSQNFISDNEIELRDSLEALAYIVEQVRCTVSKEIFKEQNASSEITSQKVGLVDIKA